jgi:hypothetical protein
MKVQEYLRSGKTLDDLNKELGIGATHHDALPLVILNYSQIDSPKTHEIVRECRGLVLNKENWSIVAKPMNRFFNWGEVADEMPWFRWETSVAEEKADGSLCIIFHFNGEWHANTRASFANAGMLNEWQAQYFQMPLDFTWRQGFLKALNINSFQELDGQLDRSLTYICEFCSPWNKVVKSHAEPCMYLLTCFAGEEEVGPKIHPLFRPLQTFPLKNSDDVVKFVNDHPETTFEGCVVKDADLRRWKIKNPRYLSLHKIKGNGDNLYMPKNLMPFILSNEVDEIKAIYPEVTKCLENYKERVDSAYAKVESIWNQTWQIENQKDFALSIVGKTPFSGILFNLRKQFGKNQNLAGLKQMWRDSGDNIVKILFSK